MNNTTLGIKTTTRLSKREPQLISKNVTIYENRNVLMFPWAQYLSGNRVTDQLSNVRNVLCVTCTLTLEDSENAGNQ